MSNGTVWNLASLQMYKAEYDLCLKPENDLILCICYKMTKQKKSRLFLSSMHLMLLCFSSADLRTPIPWKRFCSNYLIFDNG